jgi:hypothetical protein
MAGLQQGHGLGLPAGLPGQVGHRAGRQRQALWCVLVQAQQRLEGSHRVTRLRLVGRQSHPSTRQLRRALHGLFQQTQGLRTVAVALGQLRLFAEVVGQPRGEAALFRVFEALRDLLGLRPVARALVDAQQGEQGLALEGRALELVQCRLGAVEQAGLEEIERQRVLGAVAVLASEVGAREQVLVHPHGALVFAAAAEQVAQREVQLGRVRVVLHRLDEGIDRLVLLFVQQEVQAAEVGLGREPVLDAQLAQVEARGEPAQAECDRQSPKQPGQVKVHASAACPGQ